MSEVEETLKRIQTHKGVKGMLVLNADGIPIRSTLDPNSMAQYSGHMLSLIQKAKATIKEMDPSNELTFIRIRSKKSEILVAPDREYALVAVQSPGEGN